MNGAHEPLHQPPNPDDLRRQPPASPDCARTRGWMRDFADGDLDPARVGALEDHVHRCRVCAVELARAEHEVMRLRSAFAAMPASAPRLPSDFAARVVERLVLDETAMLGQEALARAVAAAGAVATPVAAAPGERARRAPGAVPAWAIAWALGSLALLWLLALGGEWFEGAAAAPQPTARLVVESASDAFVLDRRVAIGDGLGERDALRVGRGGRARLYWHDPLPMSQPAAVLLLHGDARVRLDAAGPDIDGRVDIETMRPVSIRMADGSRVDFGEGEYSISVAGRSATDDLTGMPADLLVEIAVKSGDEAVVVRDGFGPAVVAAGFIGAYQTGAEVVVKPNPGGLVVPGGLVREGAEAAAVTRHALVGYVRDGNGGAVAGLQLHLAFGQEGQLRSEHAASDAQGGFDLALTGDMTSPWVVARALAPQGRTDLGCFAPEAFAVVRNGPNEVVRSTVQFPPSAPFVGAVRDEAGAACAGVLVQPCVVDELFGNVHQLPVPFVQTDAFGMFRCERLPARLPPHQALVLVLHHAAFEPRAVAIPTRASTLASLPFPAIEIRRLQVANLRNLPRFSSVEVCEEVPGLPPGTAIVRRIAVSDGDGHAYGIAVGRGACWLRVVGESGNRLRRLVRDYHEGLLRLQPEPASQFLEWSAVFGDMVAVAGEPLETVATSRFDGFALSPASNGPVRHWVDATGLPVEAQVFELVGGGAEERAAARFLGFSAVPTGGSLTLPARAADLRIVAVARDGSTSFSVVAPGSLAAPLVMQATGRVLVPPSLRPANSEVVIPVEFVGESSLLPGIKVRAVRFASALTGWEVRDLVPGNYAVRIGTEQRTVDVPLGGGFAVLPH